MYLIAAMTVARVAGSESRMRACNWGRYLDGFVDVSLPRHAAATFRVLSSELAESWKSGTHIVSATFSNWPGRQLLTT